MPARTAASLALLLSLAALARADDVTLTDGTVIHGKVTMETDDRVIVQLDTGREVLTRREVAAISKTAPTVPVARVDIPAKAPAAAEAEDIGAWPPVVGAAYPDLVLRDCFGKVFHLSSLRGKTILVEPVAMSCPACQAFAGGHEMGTFEGVAPQDGIESMEANLQRFAHGLRLDNPNLAYVQVVIYNAKLEAPTVAEVRGWADHFHLTDKPNVHVLVGTKAMISDASFNLIPGLHLVDRSFVLRSAHSGRGGSDLYLELLPLTASLVARAN
jgi:hypothetical protein